jgi:aerobic carbon-monoxide dehydrogenase large subunit
MSSEHQATGHGIGQAVTRKEDNRLLRGLGRYVPDIELPGMVFAAVARSPHANALIRAIDKTNAKTVSGVIAVYTAADFVADGGKPIAHMPTMLGGADVTVTMRDGFTIFIVPQAILASDHTRYVGEPVALVVAETTDAAKDGVEMLEIDYEPLPAVASARDAVAPGAPLVWEECADNLCVDVEVGDKVATEAAFASATHITRIDTWIPRVTGTPMEPRTAIGDYDRSTERFTIYAGSGGGVVKQKEVLAEVLGLPQESCRVVCGDMGGNFGTRNNFYPEWALLPWAAKQIGRPVKWAGDRQESFLSDFGGRDLSVVAELALDKDGKFLGLRGTNLSNLGAYPVHFTPLRKGLGIMSGNYDIPAIHFRGCAAFTNTVPTIPYRSAGRPEAIYVIERLVDLAANEIGIDRVELRRRNLVRPEAFPYTNAVGLTYDNAEYEKSMDAALKRAEWDGFAERRKESQNRGLMRGIGVANYMEVASGFPRERAEITVSGNGQVELVLGTMNSGQGHETSFAQLLVEWLGVPFESVQLVAHDTDRVVAGGGSHSGRSMRLASLVMGKASETIVAKGKLIAAHLLEANAQDIEFNDGVFTIKGTDRGVGIFDVAEAAETKTDLPEDLKGKLAAIADQVTPGGAFPYGTHICEVEVDPETGVVRIVQWSGIDDVGRAINPLILHGQTHGAAAQGIGEALLEICYYDRKSAQVLSGSFMDYAVPRADFLPSFNCGLMEVPATSHKYGIRPGGEGGTTPALGAVINAIADALSELGIRHVEMPATPQRVWKAIQDAKVALDTR